MSERRCWYAATYISCNDTTSGLLVLVVSSSLRQKGVYGDNIMLANAANLSDSPI